MFMKKGMQTTVKLMVALLLLLMADNAAAEHVPYLAEGVIDTTRHETLGLKKSETVRTVTIFTATEHSDHYATILYVAEFAEG